MNEQSSRSARREGENPAGLGPEWAPGACDVIVLHSLLNFRHDLILASGIVLSVVCLMLHVSCRCVLCSG